MEAGRHIGSLGAGPVVFMSLPVCARIQTLVLMKEQQVPLTTEPPLHAHFVFIKVSNSLGARKDGSEDLGLVPSIYMPAHRPL